MSDHDQNQDQDLDQENLDNDMDEVVLPVISEIESLKKRADFMGLKYHPNIGIDKLREKIAEHMNAPDEPKVETVQEPVTAAPVVETVVLEKAKAEKIVPAAVTIKAVENPETGETVYSLNESPIQKRQRLRRWANEKVRVRVTNMNPNKKDHHGEIFTVGNAAVGTLKEFVPFNAPDGWHVSRMILETMQARQCQIFVNRKTERGVTVREGRQIKEFAIEFLDPLTQTELNELARRQAMANGQE